jgi:hypothetical protein
MLIQAIPLTETIEEIMPRGRPKKEPVTIENQPLETSINQGAPMSLFSVAERDDLITRWMDAQSRLTSIKAEEHSLRQQLVTMCSDVNKFEGTETIDIGYGYSLRVKKDLNITASKDNNLVTALLAAVGSIDAGLANELVRWQAEIAKKAYRQVIALAEAKPEIATALHAAITAKPGMPQLEMVPPKTDEPAQQ